MLVLGNDEEVAERLSRFANHGLEHVVLGLFTGLLGGLEEMLVRIPMLGALRQQLQAV